MEHQHLTITKQIKNGNIKKEKYIDNTPKNVDLTIFKENEKKERLPEAKFVIYREVEGTREYLKKDHTYKKIEIENIKDNREYIYTTNEDGTIGITGLEPGTYYALEVEAPPGYKKIDDPIELGNITEKERKPIEKTIINTLDDNDLTIVKKDEKGTKLPGAKFVIYREVEGTREYLSKDNTYVKSSLEEIKNNDNYIFETKEDGKIVVKDLEPGTYYALEIEAPEGYKKIDNPIRLGENTEEEQEPIIKRIENKPDKPDIPTPDIPDAPIKVTIHKVDQDDNTIVMGGVGFKFYSVKQQGWLTGSYSFVSNENDATWFITDSNGDLTLSNLPTDGEWIYKEDLSSLPYGYNVSENEQGSFKLVREYKWEDYWVPTEDGGYENIPQQVPLPIEETITVTNKQKYVKLSGFVWNDKVDAKSGDAKDANNLFRTPDEHGSDENDLLFDGITVRLMDRTTGQEVMHTKTDNLGLYTGDNGHNGHGEYQFVDVEKDKLQDYYIEFEYDGINYTNVQPNVNNETNGSKAMETEQARSDLNNKFGSVEMDTAVGTRSQANVRSPLMYDVTPGQGEEKQTSSYIGYRDSNYEIGLGNSYIKQVIGNDKLDFPITANTDATGYKLINNFTAGQSEIRYINLGLKDRDRPDITLGKDLQNVKVKVNGCEEHTYNYDQRYDINSMKYDGEGFNVGVKFESKYKRGSYSRAIYKSDMEYKPKPPNDPKEETKELQVFVTYKIKMVQANTNLKARVNSIVDYYDEDYTVECAGYKIDGKGNVIDKISDDKLRIDSTYDKNGYRKVLIQCDKELTDQVPSDIYVRFKLSREQVLKILRDKDVGKPAEDKPLDNIAEINSYSIFDKNGNPYAGVDKDSNPGNFEPGAGEEDDTDSSPSLILEVAEAREITGKVFEDDVVPEPEQDPSGVMTGKERKGDGIYGNKTNSPDEKEKGIGGVAIEFKDKTSGITYKSETVSQKGRYNVTRDDTKTVTDGNDHVVEYTYKIEPAKPGDKNIYDLEEGDFYITNYIPGDYTLTYIWGDENYPVQKYKGTIYDKGRYDSIMSDPAKRWWDIWDIDKKDGNETKTRTNDDWIRRTDAIDNYKTRQQIDEYMRTNNKDTNDNIEKIYDKNTSNAIKNEINSGEPKVITKMDSSTPEMKIGVEYETIYSASGGDRYTYCIDEVDFGIVERAKQRLDLEKRIKAMKVTLANGQVIVDLELNEDRTIKGERNSITYMKPNSNIEPRNGFIRLELDNELIQGTRLEVTYEIKATNKSELDYIPLDYNLAKSKDATFYKFGVLDDNQEIVTISPTGIIDYLDKEWSFDSVEYKDYWDVRTANGTAGDITNLVKEDVINSDISGSTIAKKMILYTEKLADKRLAPPNHQNEHFDSSATVDLNVSKKLTTTDEISLDNETEEVIVSKTGGSILQTRPGNYIPGKGATEEDDSMAETSIVTPATGGNLNYLIPIVVGTTALIILGVGVIVIKKKVITSK